MNKNNVRAIDLYSGIGGWTLGMKMSNVKNVASYEWWSDANETHNLNFGTNHKEVDIRKLALSDLPKPGTIDFVLGSPPCTQFSYANRGGNGDIADGLKDIYKFLEIVEYLKPKYWAMENVPRVSKIIKRELKEKGQLNRFNDLFSVNIVVNSADYGVPQARKRMIAGNFPEMLFEAYKDIIQIRNFKDVVEALSKNTIIDPIYGIKVPSDQVTDNYYEEPLSEEEERINREAKTYHPVYNNMSFPDDLDRPARTITATCTRVSRESIIIPDRRYANKYRRLNIRERGLIQSFPVTYQFHGKSGSSRFKMIGNAIPPLLSYYIIQSMLEKHPEDVLEPYRVEYKHVPVKLSKPVKMHTKGSKYPKNRSFKFAIPHLRFGSGVRFNLSNIYSKDSIDWEFEFYYGNSKNIKHQELNGEVLNSILEYFDYMVKEDILTELSRLDHMLEDLDPLMLQKVWCKKEEGLHPFEIVDLVGEVTENLVKKHFPKPNEELSDLVHTVLNEKRNKKLARNSHLIVVGFLVCSWGNILMDGKHKVINITV